jgi:soluble lytic murein transglycosylase
MTDLILTVLLAAQLITMPMALEEMSVREGVDPTLAACIVTHESNWDTNLVGAAGEIGLMQILPSTGEWAATKVRDGAYSLYDPVDNFAIGLWILARYPHFYHTLYLCK